jgi:hypothetical protein
MGGLILAAVSAAPLPAWSLNILLSTNRWLHLVASTLLVGGVLFFAFVVPMAVGDLQLEQRLAVFGYARWKFRRIVAWSILALVVTGGISLWRMWSIYSFDQTAVHDFWHSASPWVFGHVIVAVLAAPVLVRLTSNRKIRDHLVGWLWGGLMLLLVAMLLASVARQLRLNIDDLRTGAAVSATAGPPGFR